MNDFLKNPDCSRSFLHKRSFIERSQLIIAYCLPLIKYPEIWTIIPIIFRVAEVISSNFMYIRRNNNEKKTSF